MNHQVDHGESDHRFAAGREGFVILAEPAVLAEPAEGSFDDPAPWQHHERRQVGVPFDDLKHPLAQRHRPVNELPRVACIRPDQFQSREFVFQFRHRQFGTIAILNAGRMHYHGDDQAERVDDQMPFSAGDFLPRVVSMRPPFRGAHVLMDWLSRMPALGVACRPAATRTCSRSESWSFSHVPSRRNCR